MLPRTTTTAASSPPQPGRVTCLSISLMMAEIAIGLSLNLLVTPEARAASYTFSKIADTSSLFSDFPAPSINNGSGFTLNNGGTVAFEASLVGGGEGVFTSNGTNLTTIAQTDNYFSSFGGRYARYDPVINDSGTVAFYAQPTTGFGGIYTGNGSTTTLVASGSMYGPDPVLSTTVAFPWINNVGTVVYDSLGNFRPGRDLSPIKINDEGVRVYLRSFSYDGSGTLVTSDNKVNIPIGVGAPFEFGGPFFPMELGNNFAINNAGTVVIADLYRGIATNNGYFPPTMSGVFKVNGSNITPVIQAYAYGNPYGSNGSIFASPSINNNGIVAFQRGIDNQLRPVDIFTANGLDIEPVVSVGDSLFDSTVTALRFSTKGLNDAQQVAFYAQLANGTSGIFRADPVNTQSVPEPNSGVETLGLLTLGLALVRQKLKRVVK